MNVEQAIQGTLDMSKMICLGYIEDLSDEEMMHRPHPEINHIKWQIGHLIVSEHNMINAVAPGSMPALPEGFAEKYTKEMAASNDAAAFDTKEELLKNFHEQRAATLTALQKVPAADLDNPTPESMQAYAPTVGAAFNMQGAHWLMHCGQWAVIRRQLGRPPLY
jgi:uncharacterized damage-inducible protein DinB